MGLVKALFGKELNKMVDEKLNDFKYEVPNREQSLPKLLTFRQQEYNVWASGNPADLLKFYGNYTMNPSETSAESRQLFWEWVAGVNTVPKLHFPTPEIIINQMKSLLFSDDLDIYVNVEKEKMLDDSGKEKDDKLSEETTNTLREILLNNDSNEKYQSSVMYETYSGTVAWRYVMDSELSDYPIIIPYPAERVELKSKLGKIQEIIFLDEYKYRDKKYTLKSHYGKGYIKYHLWFRNKEVALNTVPELAEGYDDIVITLDGTNPIPIMLATYKKNRSSSNEFMGTEYGGSDFEGLIDTFHLIDELYSQKNLYIRRARPFMSLTDRQVTMNDKGKATLPKEYELDTIIRRGNAEDKTTSDVQRSLPDLLVTPYDDSITREIMTCFLKIGLSRTSGDFEGVGANASGDALERREKSTIVTRQNKIKLWKSFLQNGFRLLLIYNSLKDNTPTMADGVQTFKIDNDFDYTYQIDFPTYNNQTLIEKLEEATKAKGLVFDTKTTVEHVLRDLYTKEEKAEIVKNLKIEEGIPLIGDEFNEVE
jgi:hypothetical protein